MCVSRGPNPPPLATGGALELVHSEGCRSPPKNAERKPSQQKHFMVSLLVAVGVALFSGLRERRDGHRGIRRVREALVWLQAPVVWCAHDLLFRSPYKRCLWTHTPLSLSVRQSMTNTHTHPYPSHVWHIKSVDVHADGSLRRPPCEKHTGRAAVDIVEECVHTCEACGR